MKNKITGIIFISFISFFLFLNIVLKDTEFSNSEKRLLAKFETPTFETITDGSWFKDFETYTNDQFPLRSEFRSINAYFRTIFLNQSDIGGIYTENDYIFKSDYPLKENNIDRFANKTNEIYENFLKGKISNYYVSVIPDKTHFSKGENLVTNANDVAQKFSSSLTDAQYIDIFPALSLDSYYKTDTHWSQNKLFPVMDIFAEKMDFTKLDKTQYNSNTLSDFYGVYHGQSALNIKPDELVYLQSIYTDNATVENLDKPDFTEVYDLEEFNSEDGYNLFLSGGTPITKITSENAKTDKELVIFRDSFGSSISPLFLETYKTVTLVDLRYFSSSQLEQYIDFQDKDVLVLYSTLILNSNIIFR